MAYIGQAAINMRVKGLINAKTIHSWLYQPVEIPLTDAKGNIVMDTYYNVPKYRLEFIPRDLDGTEVLFIDESGTVPAEMKEEILSRGIKIIAAGDLAQLKPIFGESAFLRDPNIVELTEIMRQDEGSYVLHIADRARRGLPIHRGVYGKNVLVISENELNNEMILNSNVVLCGTNKTRDYMNKRIRNDILGIDSSLPVQGDRVVCRRNNWNVEVDGINLANGLNGVVTNSPNVLGYTKDVYTIDFKPFLTNGVFKNVQCDYKYLLASHKERLIIKNNRYNRSEKFEYGYALTTHMAQGSQYSNGIYISEYMGKEMQPHIDYTGPTRFINGMIYVIKGKRYF